MKIARLAYLLAQHPFRLHRKLVQRGLATQWIEDFKPFWDTVRPPGLPLTDYASYTWLEYYFASRFRERYPEGDHFEDRDAQYARLLSYVKRRELHPLRMLKVAWALRGCKAVLEYGAGAAPYAHFIEKAWPFKQKVSTADIPGTLSTRYQTGALRHYSWWEPFWALKNPWDGIVCTEVFEHLRDPFGTARLMRQAAPIIAFDYVDDKSDERTYTLEAFRASGRLTGPDKRGLYIWRKESWSSTSLALSGAHASPVSATAYVSVGMTSSTTGTPVVPQQTTSGNGTRKRAGGRTKKR